MDFWQTEYLITEIQLKLSSKDCCRTATISYSSTANYIEMHFTAMSLKEIAPKVALFDINQPSLICKHSVAVRSYNEFLSGFSVEAY